MTNEVEATTKRTQSKRVSGRKGKKRCWSGYKSVKGKSAYAKGSCKKA